MRQQFVDAAVRLCGCAAHQYAPVACQKEATPLIQNRAMWLTQLLAQTELISSREIFRPPD